MKSRMWCWLFGVVLSSQFAWGTEQVKLELLGSWHPTSDLGWSRSLSVDANTAALLQHDWTPPSTVHLLDISNPHHPVEVSAYTVTEGLLTGMQLAGTQLLLTGYDPAGGGPWFTVVDISNPRDPIRKTTESLSTEYEPVYGLRIEEDTCYLVFRNIDGSGGGVEILDISQPDEIAHVGSISGDVASMDISGRVLWLVERTSDPSAVYGRRYILRAIDVHDPSNPLTLAQYDIETLTGEHDLTRIHLSGQNAFLISYYARGGNHSTVSIVDVSEPSECHLLSTFSKIPRSTLYDVFVTDGKLFLALQGGGLQVIDVANPTNPRSVGHLQGFRYDDIHVVGSVAYVVAVQEVDDPLAGLHTYGITELPAITREFVSNNKLHLQWNIPARGMKLQRTTSLANPDWQDLVGSEGSESAEFPLWSGQEFFRLVNPE